MPTYEYGCEACGNAWEIEQRISESPIRECPKCGQMQAKRLISGGNFVLKGGGWYADGYGSSSKSSKSDKGGSKPEKGGSEPAKSEAKSEPKSESVSSASSED